MRGVRSVALRRGRLLAAAAASGARGLRCKQRRNRAQGARAAHPEAPRNGCAAGQGGGLEPRGRVLQDRHVLLQHVRDDCDERRRHPPAPGGAARARDGGELDTEHRRACPGTVAAPQAGEQQPAPGWLLTRRGAPQPCPPAPSRARQARRRARPADARRPALADLCRSPPSRAPPTCRRAVRACASASPAPGHDTGARTTACRGGRR